MNNVVKLATVIPSEQPPDDSQGAPLTFDTTDLCFQLRTSPATLHRLRASGKLLKSHRFGSQLRWDAEEVKAWIKAGMPDARTWEAIKAAKGRVEK